MVEKGIFVSSHPCYFLVFTRSCGDEREEWYAIIYCNLRIRRERVQTEVA